MRTKLQHLCGLAVIKRTVMQKARQNQELQKWMPAFEQKKTGRDAVFPQTWAAVVAAPAPQKTQAARGQKRSTDSLGTSHPSKTVHLNTTSTATVLGDVVQKPAHASAVISTTRAVAAVEGINGPDGIGDICPVVVLTLPACTPRVLAYEMRSLCAHGLLAVR